MPDTTPAEQLRQAAKLMRERAEAASLLSPPPWYVVPAEGMPPVPWVKSAKCHVIAPGYLVDCEHIAGMHPGVALAVADWLDRFGDKMYCYGPAEFDHALAIARAFLGTGENR